MKEVKKIFSYIKPYKIKILIVFFLSILYSILYVLSPKILAMATNRLVDKINTGITYIDIKYIYIILLICLFIYIITNAIKYFNSVIINRICNNISYKLKEKLVVKINKIKIKSFDNNSYGDILSRINNDVSNISNNLEEMLNQTITGIICFIGIFIMMFSISKLMTIITIILIPIQIILMGIVMIKSQKYFDERQNILSNINENISNMISNHKFIKSNNLEDKENKNFIKINNQFYNCNFKGSFISSIILPIINFTNNISYIIISIVGGILAINRKIKIGDIQAFLQYMQKFNENSESVGSLSTSFQLMISSIKHIEIFLNEEEESCNLIKINKIKGNIEFKNVCFSYDENKKIIKNFNFNIKSGTTVAIVGHTGSGKTTLINLLLKYYENYKGDILIDGISIKKIDTNNLRNRIGYIPQDNWIFQSNIKDNIIYDEPGNKLFNKIDKEFELNKYIDYNMMINEEGDNISLSEKQIISIFRTLIKDQDMIILDEATSNIDSRTEILIQALIKKTIKNKTAIIIAHRLTTIKDADVIIVMDKGRICEIGTHKELLKNNGKYKSLCNNSI